MSGFSGLNLGTTSNTTTMGSNSKDPFADIMTGNSFSTLNT
jgi:hypothetical protein